MPERPTYLDFGQTRVDERLLATMSDLERHIFFRRLEQTEAARLKGKLAFEIAQAVMDWGKPVVDCKPVADGLSHPGDRS